MSDYRQIEPHTSEPEIPECPACGEYLYTDYRGRVEPCRWCTNEEMEVPARSKHPVLVWILTISIAILLGALLARGLFGEPISPDSNGKLAETAPCAAKAEDQQKTPAPIGLGAGVGLPKHAYFTEGKVAVEWHLVDEYRVWLSVNTASPKDWPKEGFHPSFTYVLSQYKPMVKKLPNGQWQIQFTSEIAEDLP